MCEKCLTKQLSFALAFETELEQCATLEDGIEKLKGWILFFHTQKNVTQKQQLPAIDPPQAPALSV